MKPRPILFRADASHAIGFGHLARIAALVDECTAQGREAMLLAGGDLPMVNGWLHDRGLVNRIRSRRVTSVLHAATEHDVAAIVLDGPHLVAELGPSLVSRAVPTAVIDDHGGLALRVDTVINHNFHAPELASTYTAPRLLLGRSYALLRRDIRRLTRGSCRPRAGERLRVVLTFGGSDPVGATAATLRLLPAARPIDAVVLAGPGFRDDGELHAAAEVARLHGHSVDIHRAPKDPGSLFVTADAAIAAAGGTLAELAFLGCPALGFAIVADQRAPAAAQAAAGVIAGGLDWQATSEADRAAAIAAFLVDDAARNELRQHALATIDGAGASRVIAALAS